MAISRPLIQHISANEFLKFRSRKSNETTLSFLEASQIYNHYVIQVSDSASVFRLTGGQIEEGQGHLGSPYEHDLVQFILGEAPDKTDIDAFAQFSAKLFNKGQMLDKTNVVSILPVHNTFMRQFLGTRVKDYDYEIIFEHYDKRGFGELRPDEISDLARDLMAKNCETEDERKRQEDVIKRYTKTLMHIMDKTRSGYANRLDLKRFLKLYLKLS